MFRSLRRRRTRLRLTHELWQVRQFAPSEPPVVQRRRRERIYDLVRQFEASGGNLVDLPLARDYAAGAYREPPTAGTRRRQVPPQATAVPACLARRRDRAIRCPTQLVRPPLRMAAEYRLRRPPSRLVLAVSRHGARPAPRNHAPTAPPLTARCLTAASAFPTQGADRSEARVANRLGRSDAVCSGALAFGEGGREGTKDARCSVREGG